MDTKTTTALIEANREIYEKMELLKIKENLRILICEYAGVSYAYISFLKEYCGKMSIPAKLLRINEGNEYAEQLDEYSFQRYLNEFQPTVLFIRDRPAKNWKYILPPNLVVLTIVDKPNLLWAVNKKKYLELLDPLNFLLLPFDWPRGDLRETGEDLDRHVIWIPSLAPEQVFKKGKASESDEKRYGADVMIVGNKMSFEAMKQYFSGRELRRAAGSVHEGLNEKLLAYFEGLCQLFYEEVRNGSETFYDSGYERAARELIHRYELDQEPAFCRDSRIFLMMAYEEAKCLAWGKNIAKWVIEGGYDVKLYGIGWEESEDTAPYAMGKLDYATELPKAYYSSKISVGTNPVHLFHQRMLESLLCGCLYLSPTADESYRLSGLKPYFQDGVNIRQFSNQEQLYSLLDYYLEHGDERREMAERGRRTILDNGLTAESVWERVLKTVAERVERIAEEMENVK